MNELRGLAGRILHGSLKTSDSGVVGEIPGLVAGGGRLYLHAALLDRASCRAVRILGRIVARHVALAVVGVAIDEPDEWLAAAGVEVVATVRLFPVVLELSNRFGVVSV